MASFNAIKSSANDATYKQGAPYISAYLTLVFSSESAPAPSTGSGETVSPRPSIGWMFPRSYRP